MFRNGLLRTWLLALALTPALGRATTAGGAVQGTLFAPGGAAVTSNNVNFKVQVLDKNGTCVLYEESHLGVDLSNTNGDFSFDLGSGTSRTNFVKSTTVLDTSVFKNDANLPAFSGCASGVTLAAGDDRLLRVQFDVGSGYARLEPDMHMMGGVYSAVAETVQGKGAADLVQIKNTGSVVLTQTNAEDIFSSVNFPKLQALLAGSSSLYLPTGGTSPVNINGNRLINVGTPTASTDAATKGYADTTIGGKSIDFTAIGAGIGGGSTLLWDQATSKWVAGTMSGVTPGGAAGGDLTGTYPNPTIKSDAITTAKIKSSGGGVNRLLITDASTGTTITFAACSTNEVMKWTASGWACSSVGALAPVTTVAGKTGAVTLNAADVSGLGTVVTKDYGTGSGQVPVLDGTGRLPASNLPTNVLLNGGNAFLANVGIGTITPQGGLDIATTGTLASALIVPRDTTANRPVSTAVNGMLRYNTNLNIMEAYENGAWKQMIGGAAGSSALSGLTAATATNAIDSLNYAQTWNWSTAGTQTPLTINANALTTGSLLTLATTNTSVNSTNGLLYVANMGNSNNGTILRAQSNSTAGSGLTVLANGNVGIGSSTPTTNFFVTSNGATQFVLESTQGTVGSEYDMTAYGTGAQSVLLLTSSRGNKSSPAMSQSGDSLGYLGAGPSHTAGQSARIYFKATQNWTGSSTPGNMIFQTTPPGQTVPLMRMTIDHSGLIGIGTDTPVSGLDVATTGTLASAVIVPRDTTTNRPSVSMNGMIRYNTNLNIMEAFENGSWKQMIGGGASSLALSSLTAATATNSINNGNFAQTWSWNSASTQTPLALNANALTTGSLLALSSSNYGLNSTAGLLNIANTGTSTNGIILRAQSNANAGSGLTVLASGNVGVGSTAPAYALDVSGDLNATTVYLADPFNYLKRDSNGVTLINGAAGITVNTNGNGTGIGYAGDTAPAVGLAVLGQVGIGTNSPGAKLDVYATGAQSAIIVPRDVTANRPATTVNGMIRYNTNLNVMEAYENGAWKQMIGGGAGSAALSSLTAATATNSINNANYGQTWNWNTATTQTGLNVTGSALTTGSLMSLTSSNTSLNSTSGLLNVANTSTSTSGTIFTAQSNSTAGSGLNVLANGKIGIGTSSPSALLHVSGAGTTQMLLESTSGNVGNEFDFTAYGTGAQSIVLLTSSRGTKGSPTFSLAGDSLGYLGAGPSHTSGQSAKILFTATENWTGSNNPGDIEFLTTNSNQTGPSLRMLIDQRGEVGIGTTNPMAGLDVATTGTLASAIIVPRDTTTNRPMTAVNGMIRYNTNQNLMEAYENGVWKQMIGGGASSLALSSLTPATATNSIDSTNYAQTWNWSTANTQNALTMNGASLTSGSILNLTSANSSLNSSSGLLNVANTGTSTSGTILRAQSNSTAGSGLTVLADGNVGIGTTTPQSKLHVTGGITSDNYNDTLVTNAYNSSGWKYAASAPAWNIGGYSTDATAFRILTAPSGTAGATVHWRTSLAIDAASGNIGIGANSPNATLSILNSSTTDTALSVTGNSNTYWPAASILLQDSGTGGRNYVIGSRNGIGFSISDETSSIVRLVIDGSGALGIGSSTPQFPLDVVNTQNNDTRFSFRNADTSQYHQTDLRIGRGTSTQDLFIGTNYLRTQQAFLDNRTGGSLNFKYNGGDQVTFSTNGNVGIGLTDPTYQLQLSTDSAAKPGTSTWTIASDERLKDIRAPFTRGLRAINGLNTIYFNYKKDNPLDLPSEKEYVGIKAQDAQKVIPESVSTDEQGYLHVTNDSIIWTAVNAIKELYSKFLGQEREIASIKAQKADKADTESLRAEVKAMDQKIKELEQRDAEMKARLDTIKKMIKSK